MNPELPVRANLSSSYLLSRGTGLGQRDVSSTKRAFTRGIGHRGRTKATEKRQV